MNYRTIYRAWHKPTQRMLTALYFTPDFVCVSGEIIPRSECELMQSTGMKDKNGRLIFEKDIVRHFHIYLYKSKVRQYNSVVVWDKDRWQLGRYKGISRGHVQVNKRTDRMYGLNSELAFVSYTPIKEFTSSEVIGNTFENIELIYKEYEEQDYEERR